VKWRLLTAVLLPAIGIAVCPSQAHETQGEVIPLKGRIAATVFGRFQILDKMRIVSIDQL
jgi:hypothetical protein